MYALQLGLERLLKLLPDRWAAAHSNSVRVGRKDENADRSEVKRAERARRRLQAAAPTTTP